MQNLALLIYHNRFHQIDGQDMQIISSIEQKKLHYFLHQKNSNGEGRGGTPPAGIVEEYEHFHNN